MKGIIFGNYHSYDDFSLFLTGKVINLPRVKTEYVDIQGADGKLDLTEYFDEPKYENRKLTFSFETMLRGNEFYELYNEIANAIHGKRLNIVLDENSYFYFNGRINVNPYKSNEKIGKVVIDCDCDPYQMESIEIRNEFTLEGLEKEIVLVNLKKKVTPRVEVTTDSAITLTYGSNRDVLTSGTYTLPELMLVEGNNLLTISGTGTIAFTYRRGKL